MDTMSVDNSFDEFRCKGQLRIGSDSQGERWCQGRENKVGCLHSDGSHLGQRKTVI